MRPEQPFLYGIELLPTDVLNTDDWFRPADVLDAMFARSGEHLGPSSAVTATRIVTSLAYATLGRPAVGLALAGRLADEVIATLRPLIEDLHRRTGLRVAPMWNLTAEACLGPALAVRVPVGFEHQRSGLRVTTALVDALAERGAPVRDVSATLPARR